MNCSGVRVNDTQVANEHWGAGMGNLTKLANLPILCLKRLLASEDSKPVLLHINTSDLLLVDEVDLGVVEVVTVVELLLEVVEGQLHLPAQLMVAVVRSIGLVWGSHCASTACAAKGMRASNPGWELVAGEPVLEM